MPPPVGQVDIEKQCYGETWTNRYLVDFLPDDLLAVSHMNQLVGDERAVHYDQVFFTRVKASSLADDDDEYMVIELGVPGLRSTGEDGVLPLFNISRVDFTPTTGRPSRKYLRGTLTEQDVENNNILPATVSGPLAAYGTAIIARDYVVDPQGDNLVAFSVHVPVGMRQLRRGTRRRTEPVLG